jgi:AmmeMemoRadiSam system protein A
MSPAERDARGARLVALAREAIADPAAFSGTAWDESWLREPGATFVTLKLDGELRGCIGSLEPRRALGDDVVHNARAAAYGDPRFPPVESGERERLAIEVSVLSRPVPFPAVASEREALEALRPGIDGVVLEMGPYRSTFLPQVWEGLPDPADFLGELKRKAGLPRQFWDPRVKLSRYTVEKFR